MLKIQKTESRHFKYSLLKILAIVNLRLFRLKICPKEWHSKNFLPYWGIMRDSTVKE
jgi:hypothetical protein